MPAYVIVNVDVTDPVPYEDYKKAAHASITAHGGRYLARGGATHVLEGSWTPRRLVLLEFPTPDQARAWWDSSEYAAPKALRQSCSSAELVIVEGV